MQYLPAAPKGMCELHFLRCHRDLPLPKQGERSDGLNPKLADNRLALGPFTRVGCLEGINAEKSLNVTAGVFCYRDTCPMELFTSTKRWTEPLSDGRLSRAQLSSTRTTVDQMDNFVNAVIGEDAYKEAALMVLIVRCTFRGKISNRPASFRTNLNDHRSTALRELR